MLLHTIASSPNSSDSLASCLRAALPDACILLMQDGVYAARVGSQAADQLASLNCYALQADVAARGLAGLLDPAIKLIDYAGFVQLSVKCHAVQSWY